MVKQASDIHGHWAMANDNDDLEDSIWPTFDIRFGDDDQTFSFG